MRNIIRSDDRGRTSSAGVDMRHTFSFGQYFDPVRTGFGSLRSVNDVLLQPGAVVGPYSHANMEIVTVMVAGDVDHENDVGAVVQIRTGDVRCVSAGTGVRCSETNQSASSVARFLQLWIVPERDGLPPRFERLHSSQDERADQLRLLASCDGREGSLTVRRDVDIYASALKGGASVSHTIRSKRGVWLQVVRGSVEANGERLNEGDGLSVTDEPALGLHALKDAEALLIDVAA